MYEITASLVGGWHSALYAALKALALFVTAATAFRVTERRTIADFTPFDWVVAVAVGAVVGRTATASGTSWLTGAAALLTLVFAHSVVARLRFIPWLRRVVDPPVRLLITDGRIHHGTLRRCRLTRADLDEALRQHGYQSPEQVRLALFESNGAVSVFPAPS